MPSIGKRGKLQAHCLQVVRERPHPLGGHVGFHIAHHFSPPSAPFSRAQPGPAKVTLCSSAAARLSAYAYLGPDHCSTRREKPPARAMADGFESTGDDFTYVHASSAASVAGSLFAGSMMDLAHH